MNAVPDAPYDAGGLTSAGTVEVSNTTLHPLVTLSPEQLRAYERAVEIVNRWSQRDEGLA